MQPPRGTLDFDCNTVQFQIAPMDPSTPHCPSGAPELPLFRRTKQLTLPVGATTHMPNSVPTTVEFRTLLVWAWAQGAARTAAARAKPPVAVEWAELIVHLRRRWG